MLYSDSLQIPSVFDNFYKELQEIRIRIETNRKADLAGKGGGTVTFLVVV